MLLKYAHLFRNWYYVEKLISANVGKTLTIM